MQPNPSTPSSMQANYSYARRLIQHVIAAHPEDKLAFNTAVSPHWLDAKTFWYECETPQGKEYRLVDCETKSESAAFDHQTLADALSASAQKKIDVNNLPITQVEINLSPLRVNFVFLEKNWTFDGKRCDDKGNAQPPARECVSLNGQYSAFVRDHNLWLRNLKDDGQNERPLTFDGEQYYAYGDTPNMVAAGQELPGLSDLQVLWSPDSQRLLAVQLDMREVKSLPVVHHVPEDGSLRPQLETYKFPMPGDTHIPEYRLVSIDINSGDITPADYPAICFSYLIPFFTDGRGWWSADNKCAYFVDLKRGAQQVHVVEFNTVTGKTRVLFEEASSTWINLHPMNYHSPALFMPLPETKELIWYSERSGWAHLYLYDLETGDLKQTITQGDWVVREVLRFDSARRELWLQTGGRTPGRDPYYKDICRVNIDSGELFTVISTDHDYIVDSEVSSIYLPEILYGVSPGGDYVLTTRSRTDQAPVSLLLDRQGQELMVVEKANVSRLPENWQWPEPVSVKAADRETDIYGLMFRPSHFSPEKSYPVIDCMFAYPSGTLTTKAFDVGHHYMYSAALAELGFIVLQLDGRGTPFRSRKFLDHTDGSLTSASDLNDHIAGLKQLAERHSYIDLDRVGIFGGWTTSAGPINGMLQHPDFYKVGVTCAMPQSQLYMALCSEPFEGPNHQQTDFVQPEHLAHQLKGKLLMIHGMLDILDMPAATFRMVEALQKANKDFDLLLLPNQKHAGSRHPYTTRRILDFFVRHLLGEEPPAGFDLTTKEKG